MGVGEAAFYPSALSLLSRNVPPTQRARATATMQFGAVLGPALGTLLGGMIMLRYGWRAMFLVMGLRSLRLARVLAPPAATRPTRTQSRPTAAHGDREPSGGDPPYWLILRQRALWGGMMGTFCSNYAFYFVFSWLPLYLVNERGLSIDDDDARHDRVLRSRRCAASCCAGLPARPLGQARRQFQSRVQDRAVRSAARGVGLCLIGSSLVTGLVAATAILLLTGVHGRPQQPVEPLGDADVRRPASPRDAGWASRTPSAMSRA